MANKTIIAASLCLVGGLAYMAYKATLPRGVRNNNPLNIRESEGDKTQWEGEALLNSDKSFEEFKNPAYGFRAGARILRNYSKQGFTTLTEIINRWAPSHENDTNNYINQVSSWTGIAPVQVVDVNNNDELASLMLAMSRMEVGQYYDLKMAQKGVAMA